MTNILGVATIGPNQVLKYLIQPNVTAAVTNEVLVEIVNTYYAIAHKVYGLNVPAVIAQAIHETGYFKSMWAQVDHNYCGLGVTDGAWQRGWAFPTIELGVHAHAAHLLAYTKTPHNATCQLADPRHFDHNGKVATIFDLNNSGWSANSSGYGTAVQAIYDAMKSA